MPIKIHPQAIDLMSRVFNTHKKGLPEWLKNAREVYLKRNVPEEKRIVIINYLSARGGAPPRLECIDFGGISGDYIEQFYMHWASPEAVGWGAMLKAAEGGQGSGGKSYLRQMFEKGYFISIADGKLSAVSFVDEKKYELNFIPDPAIGKDNPNDNPVVPVRRYARDWLKAVGFAEDHNITIVRGVAPVKPVDIDSLVEEIQQHPQARQTIKTCSVLLYVNTEFKRQLSVREPDLDPAFQNPIEIPIPPILDIDGTRIRTADSPTYPEGVLRLKVTKAPLRGQALQSWNRIDFYADGPRAIGHKSVPELELKYPAFSHYVFGECIVPLLTHPSENYESQGRGPLVPGPLSDILHRLIAAEVDKILEVLAKRTAAVVASEKRKDLELLNEKLARWIQDKLTSRRGLTEVGTGDGPGKRRRKRPTTVVHAPPVRIKIHRSSLKICMDVPYDLRVVGEDASGEIVPAGKIVWKSSDSKVVQVDSGAGRIVGKAPGLATIVATNSSGLQAPPLMVQVVVPERIGIKAPAAQVKIGSNRRLPLSVHVKIKGGGVEKDAVVGWRSSDPGVVSVGQDGILVGGEVGGADVVAYGGAVESEPLEVAVEKGAAGQPGGGGRGRPQILLSGQDPDPFDGISLVILQQTDPPVHQRPYKPDYDNNVFWINLQHPLAEALLAHGERSIQWRTYHFQRVVDIYTMLELRSRFADSQELDVEQVLDETHEIMSQVYRDAKDELYAVLYDENADLQVLLT